MHPQFHSALSHYCNTVVAPAPEQWPLVKLLDQLGRYLVAYLLIHNYYAWRYAGGPAPTLSALQRAAAASDRHTAGLVAAFKAGRLVQVEPGADRRVRHLRPAPAMINAIGRSVRGFVAAAEKLSGEKSAMSGLLEDNPDIQGDLLRRSAASVLQSGTLIHPFPRVLHFARRDCGYLLLCAVMCAHYAEAGRHGAPAISLSLRALAERFQVSPAHVGNLLGEAQREGWFATGPRGRLAAIDQSLIAEFELWSSWQMAHYLALAAETVAFFAAE